MNGCINKPRAVILVTTVLLITIVFIKMEGQTTTLQQTAYTIGICYQGQCTNHTDYPCASNTDCKGFTIPTYNLGCITKNTPITLTLPTVGANPLNSFIYTFSPTQGTRANLRTGLAIQACSSQSPCMYTLPTSGTPVQSPPASPVLPANSTSYSAGYSIYLLRDGELGVMQLGYLPDYPACWTMLTHFTSPPAPSITVSPDGSITVPTDTSASPISLSTATFMAPCPMDACCYSQSGNCPASTSTLQTTLIRQK